MVELTYRRHQIATFLLLFSKKNHFSNIWLKNGHMPVWPLWHQMAIWHQIWPIWVFSETAIKMWQSGEDSKSIRPSHLLQRLNIPATPRKSAIATQTGELSRFGKITRICQEIANKAEPETRAVRV